MTADPARRFWLNASFLKLWSAKSISDIGTNVSDIALPLTAVTILEVTPVQLGALVAIKGSSVVLLSLLIGVLVDRVAKRGLMIRADLGRAILLAVVPASWMLGVLRVEVLYVMGFLVGSLDLVFGLGSTTLLPTIVGAGQVVAGNTRLKMTESLTSVLGPGIGGALTSALSAPIAILIDGLSFLISAMFLSSIPPDTRPAGASRVRGSIWRAIREGAAFMWSDRLLRPLTISSCFGALAISIYRPLFILLVTRELGHGSAVLGMLLATEGLSALAGTALAGGLARFAGPGRAIIIGNMITSLGMLLIVFAKAAGGSIPLVVAAQSLLGVGIPIYNVNQLSIRQAITPLEVLGRVNASRLFVVYGMVPIGALAGGAIGQRFGLAYALAVGAILMMWSWAGLLSSPVGRGSRATTQPRNQEI